MPSSASSSSPSSPSSPFTKSMKRRGRGRKGLRAVAVAAAVSSFVLLASPSPVHAVEGNGLRGGPRPPQHELDGYDNERQLLVDNASLGEEEETASQEERALAKRNENDGFGENVVQIDPFTTNLLEVHFPFGIKNENQLSSITSSHIARHLSDTIEASLVNLGVDFTKRRQRMGTEIRWVLEIEGVATFDEPPKEDVNAEVHRAFAGIENKLFLQKVYPRYEAVKEKREWDYEREQRVSRGRKQKKPAKKNKNKNKNKVNKNKKNKKKKPQKNNGGGGGRGGDSNVNVMGYVAGSQGQGMTAMNGGKDKDKGYEIIDGDIHVYVDGGGGGKNGSGNKPKENPGKMQMQQGQANKPQNKPGSKQQNKPGKKPQQSMGGNNLMGYVSGSQGNGKDRDDGEGYEIKNGDIYVNVRDGRGGD